MTPKRIPSALAILLLHPLISSAFGQAAATPQRPVVPAEVVELSPFTVNTSDDKGYRAENSLAGSRLNTSLRDTPASVTVFTKEFLEDIGLNDIDKLIDYSVGSQFSTQDSNSSRGANNFLNGQNLIRRIEVRGIRSDQGIDYFKSITINDGYRVDRYDESRGPNGILFGVGNAGGMINQSSILAGTRRDTAQIGYELGNYGTSRVVLRLNKVIVPKKLALAIAAVDQENSGWRKPDFLDKERLYATLTFSPTDTHISRDGRARPRVSRHCRTVSRFRRRPRVARQSPGQGRRRRHVYSHQRRPDRRTNRARRNCAQRRRRREHPRWVYIDNNNTFFDSSGTFITGSYNNPAVRAPDGTPGASGVTLSINDPSFLPYEINSGGTGMHRDQTLTNYTLTADWRIAPKLNLNISHNYQKTDLFNPLIQGTNPMISGEANRTLGVNGPANPYVGGIYIDAPWIATDHWASYRETRLTASYDFETKWKWLGQHRLAGMYARSVDHDRSNSQRLGLAGAPFNADPLNASNVLTQRVYLDENNPGTFVAADWRRVPKTFTTGGATHDVRWLDGAAGTTNSYAEQELTTNLLVAQSHFWNRRLVTTVGYRTDEGDATSFGFSTDPVLKTDVVDLDPAKASTNRLKGITRTQGAVLHVTDWFSLIGNRSSNIGIPTFTNRVLPKGTIPDPTEGQGEDYGFSLNLLSNRVSMKAVAFATAQQGQTGSGGINARYNLRNIRIADALQSVLVGPGRPISTADWTATRASLTPPSMPIPSTKTPRVTSSQPSPISHPTGA